MRRPTWIAVPLLGAAALVPLLLAAPAPPERLSPDGINGALLLCGDKPPDKALDVFCAQAGEKKASIIILIGGDAAGRPVADRLADALRRASLLRSPWSKRTQKTRKRWRCSEPQPACGCWAGRTRRRGRSCPRR